ncbi:unnamed protein product [Timema podura]|uniref:Protein phosphatase inhibitor 2 n=1 Tax=Timema podura TaxID=61482 RepID=A0ABN7PH63_TIMPD|nr:unnamed protein product [Timema podura]
MSGFQEAGLLVRKLRIRIGALAPPRVLPDESESSEGEEEETPEDKEKRHMFESKRKAHYNEYHAVKLARKLMSSEVDEEDEEEAAAEVPMEAADLCGLDYRPDTRQPSTSRSPDTV